MIINGLMQIDVVFPSLAAAYRPLGSYMPHVFTAPPSVLTLLRCVNARPAPWRKSQLHGKGSNYLGVQISQLRQNLEKGFSTPVHLIT